MRRWYCTLIIAASVPACAVTSVDGTRMTPGSEAFADYVEAVFRRQNRVATELSLALEEAEAGSPRFERLEAAELALLSACRGLNQLAREQRQGEAESGLGALGRAREAPDCERTTLAAEALL